MQKPNKNIEAFAKSVAEAAKDIAKDMGGTIVEEVIGLASTIAKKIYEKCSYNYQVNQTVKAHTSIFFQEDKQILRDLCAIVKKKEAKSFFLDDNFGEFRKLIIENENLKKFEDELEPLFKDIREIVFLALPNNEALWSIKKKVDDDAAKNESFREKVIEHLDTNPTSKDTTVMNIIKNINLLSSPENAGRYILAESNKSHNISKSTSWDGLLNQCKREQQSDSDGKTKYGILEGREKLKKEIAEYIESNEEWLSICCLIGPAGAGKTHIGWDIACNNNHSEKAQIPCENIFYFDREALSKLKQIMESSNEDENSDDYIKVTESALFIIDYVYEHVSTIKGFEELLKKRRPCQCKVAILYIERDSKWGSGEGISPGKKFYINTDSSHPNNNILTNGELERIMAQKLGSAYERLEIQNKCRQCVTDVLPKVDPVHRRPIFVTFLAEILRDEESKFSPESIRSLDSLMERYWGKRREKFFRHKEMTPEDKAKITQAAESFPKMILICVAALGRDIKIKKSYYEKNISYDIMINRSKTSDEKDSSDEKDYSSVISFLKKDIESMPEQFVKDDLITYLEEFCTTHSRVEEQNTTIVIKAEKDLLTEWLLYKEYKKDQEWGERNSALLNLIQRLKECKCTGLIPLIYRGALDFDELLHLMPYMLDDVAEEFDLNKLYEIIRFLFIWELERKKRGILEDAIKIRIENTMKEMEGQIKKNTSKDLLYLISNDAELSGYFNDFETSICYGVILSMIEIPSLKTI